MFRVSDDGVEVKGSSADRFSHLDMGLHMRWGR